MGLVLVKAGLHIDADGNEVEVADRLGHIVRNRGDYVEVRTQVGDVYLQVWKGDFITDIRCDGCENLAWTYAQGMVMCRECYKESVKWEGE